MEEEEQVEIEVPIRVIENEARLFNESMSAEVGEIAGAMAKAQGEMSNGAKDKQGYGYKYMELSTLIDIARPALSKNGIAIMQSHELNRSNKKPSVVTHTTVMHSSGQWFKSSIDLPIHEMKQLSVAQMMGVCMTYGRRYALQSICLIASEDDSDASKK